MNSGRSEPIVVFADMLGFADLVLASQPQMFQIDYAYYSAARSEQLFQELAGGVEDQLSRAFIAFHRLLDLHIET